MGCNTSKESVQPAGEDGKEDAGNGDIVKSAENKQEEGNSKDSDKLEKHPVEEDKSKDEAATRIQAAFRGHHARKSMKDTETSSQQQSDSDPTKEELEQEFREDDKELCDAATKIQASFRGHMSRKEQAVTGVLKSAEDFVENVAGKIEEKVEDAMNELEGIDLTDPDLHKAATKIQASFRGHKVRQEVTGSESEVKE